MPNFTVRVELHGVSDYSNLHAEMVARKLYTIIQDGDTKKWYHLPPAEYNHYGLVDATRETVARLVEAAVIAALKNESPHIKSLNTPPTYLITTVAGGRLWDGLKEV